MKSVTEFAIYKAKEYFNQQQGQKYPTSNQTVTCAYITENKKEVIKYLKQKHIKPLIQQRYYLRWQENNEQWTWRPITGNSRGYRFYKIKISKNYSDYNILQTVILPACAHYCCSWEIIK